MASVKLVGTLSGIFLLLLLAQAARLPHPDEESSAVAVVVPSDALDAADPKIVQVTSVEKEEGTGAEQETITDLVEGSDHVNLSLRRPFHGRHSRCRHSHRHGHRFHGGEIAVPYGNDMLPMPKDDDLAGEMRKDEEIAGAEVDLSEEERRWRRKKREHKRKKAEEDSDSDSDDEDEMEMAKKKHRRWRKKKERKEKGGWLRWFQDLWD